MTRTIWLLGYKYLVHFSSHRLFALQSKWEKSVMKWQFWPICSFHCMLCCSDWEPKLCIHVSSWKTSCEINFCLVTSVSFKKFFRNLFAVLVFSILHSMWQTLFICCNAQNFYSLEVNFYIQKLTGLKNDELADASEDRETWRELDPQPRDYREREREREKSYCTCRVLSLVTIRSKYFNFILITTRPGRELFDRPSYSQFKSTLCCLLNAWQDVILQLTNG